MTWVHAVLPDHGRGAAAACSLLVSMVSLRPCTDHFRSTPAIADILGAAVIVTAVHSDDQPRAYALGSPVQSQRQFLFGFNNYLRSATLEKV